MKRYQGYKIATFILSALVIVETTLLIFLWLGRPKKIPRVPVVIKGQIAIVLDDWGYNLNNLPILEQINIPLTLSVLPHLNYSRRVADEAHKRGFEVILHLPMEPYEKYRLEKNTIMTSMDEATIRDIIRQSLDNVHYAVGVSNHMGSKATEDRKTMGIIFKELKSRKLYFLDSFVSSRSICLELARKMHLPFCSRDIFLDNKDDPEYINGQLAKLKMRARLHRQAIGIGHDRKVTLEVLKAALPELEKEGYKFVFASELVK